MPAAYSDQFLEQGSDFTSQINLDDDNGTPLDLSYFTVVSQAKKSYYSNTATLVFDASVYDAANGIIKLVASAAQTANLAPGKLVYDVVITEISTGLKTRILEGQVFVSPGVS